MVRNMFYKDKVVLVTGGAGFVGSHFVEELLKMGAKVKIPLHGRESRIKDDCIETVSADLMNFNDCLKVCEGVDHVIHAAGSVGAAGVKAVDAMTSIRENLVMTSQMLEAAWRSDVKRFLLFSSSTVYPATDYPVKEEEVPDPHPVYFGYGWMRRYSELLAMYVAENSDMDIAICRPTAIYGRYDKFDPYRSHFIAALIRRAVEKEDPFVVWGTGEEKRDILHVMDLVRGSLLLLEKHAVCDPVNIGFGKAATIKDVVDVILKASGHEDAEIVFDTSKPSTIPVRMVDISKAERVIGFRPQVTLGDGIKDTVDWFRKQQA